MDGSSCVGFCISFTGQRGKEVIRGCKFGFCILFMWCLGMVHESFLNALTSHIFINTPQ